MTGAELKAISELLLEMAEEFEGHSANDWEVPATKETRSIVEAAIRYNHGLGREGLEGPVHGPDGKYFIWDDWLMRYLETRCNPGQPPLSSAELQVLGELLDLIAEDYFNLLVDEERIAEVEYLAARCKGETAVTPAFAGPGFTPPESVPTADRPGVSERWTKQWKSTLRHSTEWFETSWTDQHKEMADYVRTGKPEFSLVAGPWEYMNFLGYVGLLNLWKWERAGVEEGRWDGEAAASAFLASYLAATTDMYRAAMWAVSRPGERRNTELNMPFAALGFVIGMRQRAELVSRLHLAACRRGYFDPDMMQRPISAFILRLLADYFSQEPLSIRGDPPSFAKGRIPADPVMQKLLEVWRAPDPAVVAPRLIAACDIHTHQSVGGPETHLEFSGQWSRAPIAVLLVLKLREILGLANPTIDHPLTSTVIGRLPAGAATAPVDDALLKVELRMRRDGFDEKKILAAYGIA